MPLKITNLSKRYKEKWVLHDVSLDVEQSEIFGLFGASASGKTTLVEAIAGNIPISGGTVTSGDRNVIKLSAVERGFQPTKQNTSSLISIFKRKRTSEHADGKAQAIVFDAALAQARDVLLLDNPFCRMDAQLRQEKIDVLRDAVQRNNLNVVLASNDFEEILLVCDRVAVLSNGEIVQTGTPQEVYEAPLTKEVAKITGRNNLFEARRLTSSKAEISEFQTLDGEHRLFTQKLDRSGLVALNQNVILGIRPEQISLSFGASFPEDNLLKARIVGVQFLGASTLVLLDANGLKLQAFVQRLVGLNTGDECMVGLPPDRIHIFKT
jgi:ABC-type Fe3+/spermidine/putrescine transport system ATPase subunit